MSEKTIGIIGGMGPEATIDLMKRIVKETPALDDVDHIRLVVDNNPKVPSRIKALIEKTGESPLNCLQEMARKLEQWGVDYIAIPCNTAHFYHEGIQSAVKTPVLDMIGLSVDVIADDQKRIEKVGILASSAVINLELYKKRFAAKSIDLLAPQNDLQEEVMNTIRSIKAGRYGRQCAGNLQKVADQLIDEGAQALLVACTELSIIADQLDTHVTCYDSSQILAETIVKIAKEND